ncbi:HD domain-containing protein [Actinomadura verrucosospora]|uniref:Metal dependent phosphohydrolase n=1 Tax=Actinomadura verrucosospora TaxID=46165 RepID=A0A7D3VYI6_ACTVE|nr:HD domain-containing protein [Actinomadura verrucosospora]QKG26753.1 metal dependent phosphohydrolase [Actinomadura verrucosospora]
MSDRFAEFSLPDTDLTRKAYDLLFATGTPALAHHSVRTYLFARAFGEAGGLRAGDDYDDEALFLASVLHDLGLTERGNGGHRFEVDGADLAAEFLTANGLDAARVRVVWEAIALHTSRGIAHRMRPEIALTHAGTGADIAALGAERLPAGVAERAHAAFPRLEPGCGLTEIIVGQVEADPAKAPLGSLPYELARQAGAAVPDLRWTDLIAAAWPGTP